MTSVAPTIESPSSRRWWSAAKRNTPLLSGLILLLLLIVGMVLGSAWSPYDPAAIDLRAALQTPNAAHWLGTDNLGRDMLTRILVAARLDLQIAIVCVMLPFVVGSLIGAISGYIGGKVDAAIMRLVDILW